MFQNFSDNISLIIDNLKILSIRSLKYIESNLQEAANNLSRWCNENQMAMNWIKTKVMLVSTKKRLSLLPNTNLNITIDKVTIENVSMFKILGLAIDNNLSWQSHSHNVYASICKNLALLKRIRHFLPFHTRKVYYNAHVLSKFVYCISIWGNSINIQPLYKLQKRAARIILNITDIRTPTKSMFQRLSWLPLEYIVKIQTLNLVYRTLNHLTPDKLQGMFKYIYNVQSRTRSAQKELLYVPNRVRLKCRSNSFMYQGAKLWNTLPYDVRKSNSLTRFKSLLKDLYYESCFSTGSIFWT